MVSAVSAVVSETVVVSSVVVSVRVVVSGSVVVSETVVVSMVEVVSETVVSAVVSEAVFTLPAEQPVIDAQSSSADKKDFVFFIIISPFKYSYSINFISFRIICQ